MLNKLFKGIVVPTVVLASMCANAEEEKVLNVYNWNEYIEPSIIPKFEKETGIKVTYDLFDSNEVLDAKLFAGKTGYDIVVPGSDFLVRQIKAGVFQPLDKSKLPNIKNLDQDQLKLLSKLDNGNTYSLPYMAGTTGIAYNIDMIEKRFGKGFRVDSWDILFKPENIAKLNDCGVAFLNAPTEVIPTVMNYLGKDPNSSKIKDYKEAEELLLSIRPYITYFHSSQNINDIANGDICITLGWSGDLMQARDRAKEANNGVRIEYVVPKEGALIFYDMMTITKDAEHVENALKFMNFLMREDISALNSSYTSYSCANKAAHPYISEEVRNNPNIFIPDEMMKKMFIKEVLPQRLLRDLNKLWDRVKVGRK